MTPGVRVAAAARAMVGVPFRAQGRDARFGLDCVGLVVAALRAADCAVSAPRDYRLRCGRRAAIVVPAGMAACDGSRAGDVLLLRVSPAQLHLAVRDDDGIIHADAAARRVVARPGAAPWPIEAAWRIASEER
jgi:cell wall-associated NlpC family hydrolase